MFFGLAIILGIGIAFLLVGWFFGGSLMYPTIAVEGSDAFDAMSRSFAYVLNRPWRALLYGLTAVVYGTITYLFVRFFAYVALLSAHTFLKAGCFSGGDTLGPGTDRIDVLWGQPTFDTLMGTFPWDAMSGWESVSAGIIAIFVFLVAATVTAYFLSYFSSASTVIYLLLRRQVDATDTDDVYVDEAEEDFSVANGGTKAEPAPTAAPATSPAPAAASTAVAEPTPPAAPAAPAETKAPESPAAPTPPTEPPPSPTAGPIT